MLPWHFEQIKFDSRHNTGVVVSVATHIVIFLLMVIMSQLSILTLHGKIIEILETDPLVVELVSNNFVQKEPLLKRPMPIAPIVKEQKLAIKEEADAIPIKKEKIETPTQAPPASNKKPAATRYEQLLSKHFENILPLLPKNLDVSEKIYVWIKINQHGDISDYGFKPMPTDRRTLNFLDTAVAMATPVPPPPPTEFIGEYMRYFIPMNFH